MFYVILNTNQYSDGFIYTNFFSILNLQVPTTYIHTTSYNNHFSYKTTIAPSQPQGYNNSNCINQHQILDPAQPRKKESFFYKFLKCIQSDAAYRKLIMKRQNPIGHNSTSMIDRVARYLFPFSFIGCYTLYWISYLK